MPCSDRIIRFVPKDCVSPWVNVHSVSGSCVHPPAPCVCIVGLHCDQHAVHVINVIPDVLCQIQAHTLVDLHAWCNETFDIFEFAADGIPRLDSPMGFPDGIPPMGFPR